MDSRSRRPKTQKRRFADWLKDAIRPELYIKIAIVILGGLVTSTLLSLFVLPTLALRYGRFGKPTLGAEA